MNAMNTYTFGPFTTDQVNRLAECISIRPWKEVTDIMDLMRAQIAQQNAEHEAERLRVAASASVNGGVEHVPHTDEPEPVEHDGTASVN